MARRRDGREAGTGRNVGSEPLAGSQVQQGWRQAGNGGDTGGNYPLRSLEAAQ